MRDLSIGRAGPEIPEKFLRVVADPSARLLSLREPLNVLLSEAITQDPQKDGPDEQSIAAVSHPLRTRKGNPRGLPCGSQSLWLPLQQMLARSVNVAPPECGL